jgi:3-hydroxyethyl bacteriochlorophyllide a dehydrogenase
VQVVRERCPGGVQVAVDTVGSTAVVEQLMGVMKRYGHIVSAGFYGTQDKIALQPLRNRELTLDLVSGWSQARMDATLTLIAAGHLQTLPLITHHFPVAQAAAAWQLIAQKTEPVLGVILEW